MSGGLVVREAEAREIDERNRLTAPVWGNRLTVEQYLERERRLRATTFSKRGMRTWVLVRERDQAVMASCESYAMPSVVETKRGTTQGMASVFVEPSLRGKGYAGQMLGALLETFRAERAQASLLFSEVGTKIYGALGYEARPMHARQWTSAAGEPGAAARAFSRAESESALADALLAGIPGAGAFRIALYHPQLEWHRERSAIYHQFLFPQRPPPSTVVGAIAGDAWMTWTPDYRLDRLMILAARPGSADENAALVEAARRAAAALEMPVVEHWESPSIILPGGETVPRADEIPMLRPLGTFPAHSWTDYVRGCWI